MLVVCIRWKISLFLSLFILTTIDVTRATTAASAKRAILFQQTHYYSITPAVRAVFEYELTFLTSLDESYFLFQNLGVW